ncbi:MAG: diphthine synthase [Methanobacteriota archaeon]|nr:MAG: diphthine synthase [Euryarchaeota archaeon]
MGTIIQRDFTGEAMGLLVFIGLGLHDEDDITVKGLEQARECDILFTEFYTSHMREGVKEELEKKIGKEIIVLSREDVEAGDIILLEAKERTVGFLVPGDAMSATTHVDLRIRAEKDGIRTRIIHGVSIVTVATGLLGLQSYKFGRTTTLPFRQKGYFPTSPYDVIKRNKDIGLHTLVLLDLKESGETMSVREAIDYLMRLETTKKEGVVTKESVVCALGDVGSDNPEVVCDRMEKLAAKKFESQIFCLVLPAELHFMEKEALQVLAGAPEDM